MREVIAQQCVSGKQQEPGTKADLEEGLFISLFVFLSFVVVVACPCTVAPPLPVVLHGPSFILIHVSTLAPKDIMNLQLCQTS